MRRLLFPSLGLFLGGLLALLTWGGPAASQAAAQPKKDAKDAKGKDEPKTDPDAPKSEAAEKSERVAIDTADGLRLQGVWYPGKKGKQSDTIVLVHNIGKDHNMDKGNWTRLAETLWDNDFSVLRFDMRGHGRSTGERAIFNAKEFCDTSKHQQNRMAGVATANPKAFTSISVARFAPGYYPYLINDLYAVRYFLDTKNDEGVTNSGAIHFIADRESCGLVMAYMGAEYLRNGVNPPIPGQLAPLSNAGNDLRGAVFLSYRMLPTVSPVLSEALSRNVFNDERTKVREPLASNVSFLFLNAENDGGIGAAGAFFRSWGLAGKTENKDKGKFMYTVPKSKATLGIDLLKPENDLKADETILGFLKGSREKNLNGVSWKQRYATNVPLVDAPIQQLLR